jgi:hypothetical protein
MRKYTLYPSDELAPWEVKLRKRRKRNRKPTLTSVARQAAKAGIKVARYEVDVDGKIVIVTEKPTNVDNIHNDHLAGIDRSEWN